MEAAPDLLWAGVQIEQPKQRGLVASSSLVGALLGVQIEQPNPKQRLDPSCSKQGCEKALALMSGWFREKSGDPASTQRR